MSVVIAWKVGEKYGYIKDVNKDDEAYLGTKYSDGDYEILKSWALQKFDAEGDEATYAVLFADLQDKINNDSSCKCINLGSYKNYWNQPCSAIKGEGGADGLNASIVIGTITAVPEEEAAVTATKDEKTNTYVMDFKLPTKIYEAQAPLSISADDEISIDLSDYATKDYVQDEIKKIDVNTPIVAEIIPTTITFNVTSKDAGYKLLDDVNFPVKVSFIKNGVVQTLKENLKYETGGVYFPVSNVNKTQISLNASVGDVVGDPSLKSGVVKISGVTDAGFSCVGYVTVNILAAGADAPESLARFTSIAFAKCNTLSDDMIMAKEIGRLATISKKDEGGTYSNPVPSGYEGDYKIIWSDGIPETDSDGNANAQLWEISRVFYSDGTHKASTQWSIPEQANDSESLEREWCALTYDYDVNKVPMPERTNPDDISHQSPDKYGWYDNPITNAVWEATCKIYGGKYELKDGKPNWTIMQIRGEKGDRGQDAAMATFNVEPDSLLFYDNKYYSYTDTNTEATTITVTAGMNYSAENLKKIKIKYVVDNGAEEDLTLGSDGIGTILLINTKPKNGVTVGLYYDEKGNNTFKLIGSETCDIVGRDVLFADFTSANEKIVPLTPGGLTKAAGSWTSKLTLIQNNVYRSINTIDADSKPANLDFDINTGETAATVTISWKQNVAINDSLITFKVTSNDTTIVGTKTASTTFNLVTVRDGEEGKGASLEKTEVFYAKITRAEAKSAAESYDALVSLAESKKEADWQTKDPVGSMAGSYYIKKSVFTFTGDDTPQIQYEIIKADAPGTTATPYRGEYDATKTYYGNNKRTDIVKFNGMYYIAQPDADDAYYNATGSYADGRNVGFKNIAPPESTYWADFGANYDSVATGFLFAETGQIQKLTVNELLTDKVDNANVHIKGGTMQYLVNDVPILNVTSSDVKKPSIEGTGSIVGVVGDGFEVIKDINRYQNFEDMEAYAILEDFTLPEITDTMTANISIASDKEYTLQVTASNPIVSLGGNLYIIIANNESEVASANKSIRDTFPYQNNKGEKSVNIKFERLKNITWTLNKNDSKKHFYIVVELKGIGFNENVKNEKITGTPLSGNTHVLSYKTISQKVEIGKNGISASLGSGKDYFCALTTSNNKANITALSDGKGIIIDSYGPMISFDNVNSVAFPIMFAVNVSSAGKLSAKYKRGDITDITSSGSDGSYSLSWSGGGAWSAFITPEMNSSDDHRMTAITSRQESSFKYTTFNTKPTAKATAVNILVIGVY